MVHMDVEFQAQLFFTKLQITLRFVTSLQLHTMLGLYVIKYRFQCCSHLHGVITAASRNVRTLRQRTCKIPAAGCRVTRYIDGLKHRLLVIAKTNFHSLLTSAAAGRLSFGQSGSKPSLYLSRRVACLIQFTLRRIVHA